MTKFLAPLVLALTLLMAGCASSPRQQFAQVNDAYIATVQVLLEARAADVFTEEEWETEVLPLLRLGDNLLDQYDAATLAGVEAGPLLNQVIVVLDKLRPYLVRARE